MFLPCTGLGTFPSEKPSPGSRTTITIPRSFSHSTSHSTVLCLSDFAPCTTAFAKASVRASSTASSFPVAHCSLCTVFITDWTTESTASGSAASVTFISSISLELRRRAVVIFGLRAAFMMPGLFFCRLLHQIAQSQTYRRQDAPIDAANRGLQQIQVIHAILRALLQITRETLLYRQALRCACARQSRFSLAFDRPCQPGWPSDPAVRNKSRRQFA